MNQGMAGLIIGAVIGLSLGFFLAPTESAPIAGVDGPDLACLEDRQALAAQVRRSLARMADAGCGSEEARLEALPPEPVAPAEDSVLDAGIALEPLTVPTAMDAGSPKRTAIAPKEDRPSRVKVIARDSGPSRKVIQAKAVVTPEAPRQWMVQLIATPERAEADRVSAKATALELPTTIQHELVPALGKKLFKVRVGPFGSKLAGKKALSRLKAEAGLSDGWLYPRR